MGDNPRESNHNQAFESSKELEFDPKASLEEKLEFVSKCRGSIPAILIAAEFADLQVCRELVLNQGADVNVTDKNGYDVYHCAAMNTSERGLELIDFFATHGAKMERRNNIGLDAVITALRQRNFEFAIKLFNYYDSPNSFLSHCICEKLETLKFAFEKDAAVVKVKGSDEFDREISYEAAWMHSLDTFKWIIEIAAGSSNLVKSEEWQLKILEHAARNDKAGEDIARFMFSSYAINLTGEDLTNLLGVVMYSWFLPFVNLQVIALLIEHGADMNVSIEGKTLFDYCVAENSLRAAQFLYALEKEETICSRTLFYAAWKADVAMCEWLLRLPMNPPFKDQIPLFFCAASQNEVYGEEIIRYFDAPVLRAYVNVPINLYEPPLTPLQLAMKNGNLGASEALLEIGADLNVNYGTSCLLGVNYVDGANRQVCVLQGQEPAAGGCFTGDRYAYRQNV